MRRDRASELESASELDPVDARFVEAADAVSRDDDGVRRSGGSDGGHPPAESPAPGSRVRRGTFRATALLIAAIPLTLFAVASQLEPSSQGLGTHQQLGLPPCSLRVIFGIRCPSCGMTTSWAYFVQGRWADSFQVSAGGFLLALFSLAVSWFAMGAFWSSQLPSLRTQKMVTLAAVGIAVIVMLDWVRRLIA